MASFITVPASRKVGKPLPLDAATIAETLSEAESRKFDGMVVYVKDEKKYYCCIDGVVQEFKGASTGTGTGTGTGVELKTYVKNISGSDFQPIMDTVNTSEVAYYEVTIDKTTHKLENIISGKLVGADYRSVDAEVDWSEATMQVYIDTYMTSTPDGSYLLILKGI